MSDIIDRLLKDERRKEEKHYLDNDVDYHKALKEVNGLMDDGLKVAKQENKDVNYFEITNWHWNQLSKNREFEKGVSSTDNSSIGGFRIKNGLEMKTHYYDSGTINDYL